MVRGFLCENKSEKIVSEKKNFTFAVQFISDYVVADDIEKRANWHKDFLE